VAGQFGFGFHEHHARVGGQFARDRDTRDTATDDQDVNHAVSLIRLPRALAWAV
jgi:hypothetical protein